MKFRDYVRLRPKPDGEAGSINLDKVLAEIGPLGKFQWQQLLLFYAVGLAGGLSVVSFSFTGMHSRQHNNFKEENCSLLKRLFILLGYVPKYRCLVPQCESIVNQCESSVHQKCESYAN